MYTSVVFSVSSSQSSLLVMSSICLVIGFSLLVLSSICLVIGFYVLVLSSMCLVIGFPVSSYWPSLSLLC